MASLETKKDSKAPDSTRYATFAERVLAFFLDQIIIATVIYLFFWLAGFLFKGALKLEILSAHREFQLSLNALYFVYNIFFIYKFGATFGKKLVGIKVIDTNLKILTLPQVILRETVGKIFSAALFFSGFFNIIIDSHKQAWHDWLAKTYVINMAADKNINQKYLESVAKPGKWSNFILVAALIEAVFAFIILLIGKLPIFVPIYFLLLAFCLVEIVTSMILIWQNQKQPRPKSYNIVSIAFLVSTVFLTLTLYNIVLFILKLTTKV